VAFLLSDALRESAGGKLALEWEGGGEAEGGREGGREGRREGGRAENPISELPDEEEPVWGMPPA
jgi:hypothetical protein